jgi:hypoxanthine phosphoribosyltransferase
MTFYDQSKIETLISEEDLQKRIKALGQQITDDYLGKGDLVLVCVLKGSYLFLADLSRAIDLPLTVDFISVSSYGNEYHSSGVVRLVHDLSQSIENKNVLIVEDIIDTGLTMSYLLANLKTRNPKSLKVVSLLNKPSKAQVKIDIDYLGFEISDRFVIGYGLDFHNKFRNMPYIGVNLSSEVPLSPEYK